MLLKKNNNIMLNFFFVEFIRSQNNFTHIKLKKTRDFQIAINN